MKPLNMDLSHPVIIHADDMSWDASPQIGVERKRLEREAEESGKATTIVRYLAGASFPEHIHSGGEEYFVLEGTFSDEKGDFTRGTYVRNPPGTSHAPFSKKGCVIFVKLGQMKLKGENQIVVNSADHQWRDTEFSGYQRMNLFNSTLNGESVLLEKLSSNVNLPNQDVFEGEELLLLSGDLEVNNITYGPYSWMRFPAGYKRTLSSREGCVFWVKRGHLKT